MTSHNYFTAGQALAAAFLSWLLGSFDGALKILLVMVVFDYLTGVLKAGIKGTWCSDIGFHGIARKVMIFIFVGMANIFEAELLGHSEPLRNAVIYFYIINEGLSIIENAIEFGAPVPEALKKRFLAFRDKHS